MAGGSRHLALAVGIDLVIVLKVRPFLNHFDVAGLISHGPLPLLVSRHLLVRPSVPDGLWSGPAPE